MNDVCRHLPRWLREERGMSTIGVCIWRETRQPGEQRMWKGSVEEFLSLPENRSGRWLIDGGWGGPPGARGVQWTDDGFWRDLGYAGDHFPGEPKPQP